jgi:AraC-like DNA-binding protein
MDYATPIRQALDFIECNLREEIRAEDIARAVNFSTSHFHTVFARVTGHTLAEHTRRRRLACAALDLALSRRRLIDIAMEYRFESQEAFTRAFKRVYGITPGLFRRHRALVAAPPRIGMYALRAPGQERLHEERGAAHYTTGDEATRFVLEGVRQVSFNTTGNDCPENIPFPSCLASALRYLGEDYPWIPLQAHNMTWRLNYANVHILGASGMAFGLLWREGWHPDNVDAMFVADPREIIHRAFAAVGYSYEVVEKTGEVDDEARYRQRIKESLRVGRPVLAFGVVGPPECCLITGYDEGGDVLIGWNYFQDQPGFGSGLTFEPGGQFRKRDWFKQTHSIILIGEKTDRPDDGAILRDTLRWALEVARTPERFGRHSGFAAYSAWAAQLTDDDAFATDDPNVLRQRHEVHHTQAGTLAELRAWAAQFLHHLAEPEPAAMADHLRAAADCYNAEHDLMWKMWDLAGGHMNPRAYLNFARSDVRRQMVPIILSARKLDEEAAGHLEKALRMA